MFRRGNREKTVRKASSHLNLGFYVGLDLDFLEGSIVYFQ